MKLFRWLRDWHYARLRRIDVELFWPALKKHAPDITRARQAFYVHADRENAWRALPWQEAVRQIEELR